ncbi:hypothetical protein G6F32_016311 [Rhizopus arrhizus]|nr:hypothetical protein G6F32_016311 [Rhizopus arrhizus]
MPYTAMQNAAGNWVEPSAETFAAAAASADWASAKDFYLVMTNAPGAESWPITATNFILVHKKPKNAANGKATQEFFRWVYKSGDAQARQLDYVPLPEAVTNEIRAAWGEVQAADGTAVWK